MCQPQENARRASGSANSRILTSNHLVQWELCKAGLGVCIVMEEVGEREPGVRCAMDPDPVGMTSAR